MAEIIKFSQCPRSMTPEQTTIVEISENTCLAISIADVMAMMAKALESKAERGSIPENVIQKAKDAIRDADSE